MKRILGGGLRWKKGVRRGEGSCCSSRGRGERSERAGHSGYRCCDLCQCEIWLVFSLIRELITLVPATPGCQDVFSVCSQVWFFFFLHISTCEQGCPHPCAHARICANVSVCAWFLTFVCTFSPPAVVAGKWFHRLLEEVQPSSERRQERQREREEKGEEKQANTREGEGERERERQRLCN